MFTDCLKININFFNKWLSLSITDASLFFINQNELLKTIHMNLRQNIRLTIVPCDKPFHASYVHPEDSLGRHAAILSVHALTPAAMDAPS